MSQEPKDPHSASQNEKSHPSFVHHLDRSAILMIIGIILLFSTAIMVTLIAPRHVDPTWTTPSSPYQVQMYEIQDPHLYLSSVSTGGKDLQYVQHLKQNLILIAFKESQGLKIVSSPELEKYITRFQEQQLKLTSRLLMLREPQGELKEKADQLYQTLHENAQEELKIAQEAKQKVKKVNYEVLELYDPQVSEAFSLDSSGGILQNWIDENYIILDDTIKQPFHQDYGVIYTQNPREFRISTTLVGDQEHWHYDPHGRPIKDLKELKSPTLGFHSRKDLISLGEHIYAIEGCWYCHTDQTRTLIEDVVLNGSDSFPAPPSSPNEYIYQKITFPGTRRIGPDISRVGVKRPSREWHMMHFWAPKTVVIGSIMPSFRHFFNPYPNEINQELMGIPNERFEAVYQYMMTKGTRITPPTQAWWLGKDPINTKEIIEGQRRLP